MMPSNSFHSMTMVNNNNQYNNEQLSNGSISNDNEYVLNNYSMSLNNDVTPARADDIAMRIAAKLCNPDPNSHPFYCLVAYNLDQATIDRLVTAACEKGRDPKRLFTFLATQEMQRKSSSQKLKDIQGKVNYDDVPF